MKITRTLAIALIALTASLNTAAQADESLAYLHNYNIPASGLALDGYCPVAYFAVNKPVKGKREHAVKYRDVWYFFVNDEAKQEFQKSPEKYLPAYGGWCAFGMAIQDKFPVDPTSFRIVNGRLMLFLKNRDLDARELWTQGNEAELVSKADEFWHNKVNK